MLANPLQGEARKGSVFEPKLDGHRVIIHKEGSTLSMYSRTFKDQGGKLPHLEKAFLAIPFDFTLDGEIIDLVKTVTIKGQEVPIASFSGAQSVMGSGAGRAAASVNKLTFVAFDCLSAQGKNLTDIPDVLRRGALELVVEALRVHTPNVMLIPRWKEFDEDLYDAILEAGGEGVMVKNPLAVYRPGKRPHNTWFKLKGVDTTDVVIVGYKPGQGKYKGMVGAIEFGQYLDGRLVPRSRCSGMTDAQRQHFTDHQSEFVGRVMEIKYFGRVGPEKSFRHPNFVAIRDDKLPEECVWE